MMSRIAFGAAMLAGAAQGFIIRGKETDPVTLFSARTEATLDTTTFVPGPMMPIASVAQTKTTTSEVTAL